MGDPASAVNRDAASPVNPRIKSGEGDNSKVRRNNSSSRGVVAEPDQILFFLTRVDLAQRDVATVLRVRNALSAAASSAASSPLGNRWP
jgi:hypothetical protein